MAETWTAIAADIRDEYSPYTADLLTLYYRRDEALRESHCAFETKSYFAAPGTSYVKIHEHDVWVPSWAGKVSVIVTSSISVSINDVTLKIVISGGEESNEVVHQSTSARQDTLTVTILDATRGAFKKVEMWAKAVAGTTILTLSSDSIWWHQ